MNPGQMRAYRAEVAKWREACARLNRPCDDEARRALHKECGAPASSTNFTNAQLDRVLARLRSFSDMGNLKAQLKPDADEAARVDAYRKRCIVAVSVLINFRDNGDLRERDRHVNYLESMARRICGEGFDGLSEASLTKLVHVLEARSGAKTVPKSRPTPDDPGAEFIVPGGVEF
jgi:hypothetical protein